MTRYNKRYMLRNLGFMALLLVAMIIVKQLRYSFDVLLPVRSFDHQQQLINDCKHQLFATTREGQDKIDDGIPNIVHQIWRSEDLTTYPLPTSWEAWKEVFADKNYTIRLWTNEVVIKLIEHQYPWLLSTYKEYPQNVQRADLTRLVIMHAEGGIYADLDAYPMPDNDIPCLQLLGRQVILAPTTEDLGVSNHFFMAPGHSEFLLWALHEAKQRGGSRSNGIYLRYLQVFWSTGLAMITSTLTHYMWMYGLSDHDVGVMDAGYSLRIVGHAAGRSWHGFDGRLLNYATDHANLREIWIFSFCFLAPFTVGLAWSKSYTSVWTIFKRSYKGLMLYFTTLEGNRSSSLPCCH